MSCSFIYTADFNTLRLPSVQELSTRIAAGMPTTVLVHGLNDKIVITNKSHILVNRQHCWQNYITSIHCQPVFLISAFLFKYKKYWRHT